MCCFQLWRETKFELDLFRLGRPFPITGFYYTLLAHTKVKYSHTSSKRLYGTVIEIQTLDFHVRSKSFTEKRDVLTLRSKIDLFLVFDLFQHKKRNVLQTDWAQEQGSGGGTVTGRRDVIAESVENSRNELPHPCPRHQVRVLELSTPNSGNKIFRRVL